VTSDAAGGLRKARAAQAAGAAGVLFVADVHNHAGRGGRGGGRGGWGGQSRLGRYTLSDWMRGLTIPAAQISTEVAESLVAGSGQTLEALARTGDTPGGVSATRLPGVEVDLTISVDRTDIADRNVLGMIEGSDPAVRNEWIVLSAHYDHDGATDDTIFNGADDDGSGTVGVLELAEAFAQAAAAGARPRRSVLFALFNSEERGLLGAWAYTLNPVAPLDRTIAVLNMDMIGRNEEVPADGGGRFNGLEPQTAESNRNALNVIGGVRTPDLQAAIDRANRATGLEIRYRYDNNPSQLLRRSDHWPFIQNGVPGVWIFTGLHPDYHRGTDTADLINYDKMERILKLVYQVTWDLAQADGRPRLVPR
jgi:Zn-dependent M28 family amino/carboxypeptidase